MNNANLNLARKWRSKNFDQIVGQDLSVKMLRNSLYLEHYFPVYLFSGQRGCGKTTTARVFAAAVNCERLHEFRKQPKACCVPCLECASCKAMLAGKHPDFIEIDAASHTGVDNVRQIVSASQLLPLMGNKKIYLIDEAHMLSKAAFNAFLKILEEPPASVLFILATTDPQKIIETVRSRCFQLLFKPVGHDPLLKHLKNVCATENISHEDVALELVIKETQGSVRDALNVLEQVRFARGSVTKDAVLHVLGHIDDERMLELFAVLIQKKPKDLLQFLQDLRFNLFSAEFFWNKLIDLVRGALWVKYDVHPDWLSQYEDRLKEITADCSVKRLNSVLKLLYANEQLFLKTTAKHSLLEMILLQICQKNAGGGDAGSSPASQNVAVPSVDQNEQEDEQEEPEDEEEIEEEEELQGDQKRWKEFLLSLDSLNDPLLTSVFKNGMSVEFNQETGKLSAKFAKQFAFFKETMDETSGTWMPLLKKSFSDTVQLDPQFTEEQVVQPKEQKKEVAPVQVPQPKRQKQNTFRGRSQKVTVRTEKRIDVSDADVWKKAHLISRHFSGTFTEIAEA